MPSNDKKGTDKSSKKIVKSESKKKKKVSAGWVFGVIILVLIAFSFVAGSTLPAILGNAASSSLVFGSYDGEEIAYEADSYFYEQYQKFGSQYDASTQSSELALYSIWKNAFDSTVYHTAITKMAEKIGIKTTENTINNAVIKSGYYDVDGKFSKQAYESTSTEKKANIRKTITRNMPYNMVLADISSALTSENETSYVVDMANNTRSFNYVVFDGSSYPKELASQYGLTNPQLFFNLDLSILHAIDEEKANELMTRLNSGASFEELAAEESDNVFNENAIAPFYAVQNIFKDPQEALEILDASADSIMGPFESVNGWSVYKINEDPQAADFTDENTLNIIRNYIAQYDTTLLDDYLLERATTFVANAGDDFEAAATEAGLDLTLVNATAKNVSNSQYMSSFTQSDPKGLLANAASESDVVKNLFNAEVGETIDPLKTGNSYIVVNVASQTDDSGMDYLTDFYPYYYATQHNPTDLQYAIMASDKLEDNFLTVFLERILN